MTAPRPLDCRERLREAGKAYPRSGCDACPDFLFRGCPHRVGDPLAAVVQNAGQVCNAPQLGQAGNASPYGPGAQLNPGSQSAGLCADNINQATAGFNASTQASKAESQRAAAIEDEAREVANLAVGIPPYKLDGGMVYPGTVEAERLQVEAAMRILAESRRQVEAARAAAVKVDPVVAEVQRVLDNWRAIQPLGWEPTPQQLMHAAEQARENVRLRGVTL